MSSLQRVLPSLRSYQSYFSCYSREFGVKAAVCQDATQKNVNDSFKYSDLTVTVTKAPRQKPDMDTLVFGKHMSDHMLEVSHTVAGGWGKPAIVPYHSLSLDPAAKSLHYAIEIFEGTKAYRGYDGKIRLFRPLENFKRMQVSAERACLPGFNGEELRACLHRLVATDKDWVPPSQTSSLYIRPTMIATEALLGVSPPAASMLYIITCPVGPYFPTGMKPVSLLADPSYVRAHPGGTGFAKMGSNYAPTLYIQKEAVKKGCQQVLWLFGEDHQITEVGTMNLFMLWKNEKNELELATPPLDDGVILPGITRKSLLELAHQWGEFRVAERKLTMSDIIRALKEGRLLEMFGAGTACVVCPVERIHYQDTDLHIPTMAKGSRITNRFYKELTDIQYGKTKSDWTEVVEC